MFHTPHVSTPTSAWLSDPQTLAVNRLPVYSSHDSDARRQSLDGTWEVALTTVSRICLVSPTDCFLAEEACDLSVPSALEAEGLWLPAYANIQMPRGGHANPTVSNFLEDYRVAVYRRRFHLDDAVLEGLKARDNVHLRFEGFVTTLYVQVDGAFIGYCEDGHTAGEFETMQILDSNSGTEEHELVIACYEHPSAFWPERQDSWRSHGLFRSVYPTALPMCHIENLMMDTDYDAATGMGTLDIKADVCGIDADVTISAEPMDRSVTVVWSHRNPTREPVIEPSDVLSKICPWTMKDPTLYTLSMALLDAGGHTYEAVSQRVGLRRLEIVDGVFTPSDQHLIF